HTLAAAGMLLAPIATLLDREIVSYGTILAGVVVGGVIGTIAARRVAMTAMPQMVALFNGSGGGAAAIVSSLEYLRFARADLPVPPVMSVTILVGALIGAISFTGLATAATGFSLHNHVLIISGTLVGASGTLLTYLMCKAMNRPITNVLFGAFGAVKAGGPKGAARPDVAEGKQVRDVSVEDVA